MEGQLKTGQWGEKKRRDCGWQTEKAYGKAK